MTIDSPRAYGAAPIRAVLRAAPADFFVEEQLGFEPDGSGEHCWLWVEKENLNTADAAQRLARFAGLKERDISYSGLKDKRAVTRQWFSLHLLNREIDWQQWSDPALRILRVERHSKKLRRGTHRANYFEIILRDVEGDIDGLQERVDIVRKQGVPNYFGEQRFGRDGRTFELARQAAQNRKRLTRQQTSLYYSALRSHLFNAVLARRVLNEIWNSPRAGELFMLDRSHSVFQQEIDAALLARIASGDVHLSGPLPGSDSNVSSYAEVAELERSVLQEYPDLMQYLISEKVEAARRSLRLLPMDLSVTNVGEAAWKFSFALARGCFATSLMRELVAYSVSSND